MSGSGPIGVEDAEYIWEAVAEALNALDDVEASAQRQLIDQISARVPEAGNDDISRSPNGERSETFIVKLSLSDDRQPNPLCSDEYPHQGRAAVARLVTQGDRPFAPGAGGSRDATGAGTHPGHQREANPNRDRTTRRRLRLATTGCRARIGRQSAFAFRGS